MVNKESNLYTLGFAGLITICCAVLLSFTSFSLKERQERNLEVDSKKNVLLSHVFSEPLFAPPP